MCTVTGSELDDLTPYLRDSASPSWAVRAAAGRRLAAAAEHPGAAEVLPRLLRDGQDTFVVQETAEALLERGDVLGLRMVLAARVGANDDVRDHIGAAILNVCCQSDEDAERLAALCSALVSDADADAGPDVDGGVRGEAHDLLGRLR